MVARLMLSVSRAAYKAAASRFRDAGMLDRRVDWPARAIVCERCPLRVVHKNISYCGQPFAKKMDRDLELDGCGCPVRAKAMDPDEHCPLDLRHRLSHTADGGCTCKWCSTVGSVHA